MKDSVLIALVPYLSLARPFVSPEESYFQGIDNVRVAGIVQNGTPDKDGNVKVRFTEEYGGELDLPQSQLEFLVLPRKLFQ